MTQSNYFCLELHNVGKDQEDLLTEFCFAHGASGMAEQLEFTQSPEIWEGQAVEKEHIDIQVYFESPPSEEFLLQLKTRFPEVFIELKEEENRDWLEEWKKGYEPFALTPEFWIVPSWKEVPAGVEHYLKIDPQMAFGTGTHHTTQVAAELLQEICRQTSSSSLLDVGTGTGILAMMARRLGISRVEATEIDADARNVARENALNNDLVDVKVLEEQVGDLIRPYDVVVANIIDGILIELQDDLMRLASQELLLTGIMSEREDHFLSGFHFTENFKIIARKELGGWLGFWLRRKK